MHIVARCFAAVACAGALSLAAFAQSRWIGIYEFVEDGGRTAGGTGIAITHEIQVMNTDDGLVATIKSNGFQTSVDVLCLVTIQGNKASLFLEGYGDDNMFDKFSKGQLMLSLEEKPEKGKSTILTHWAAFKPSVAKNERTGMVYFVRSTEKKI